MATAMASDGSYILDDETTLPSVSQRVPRVWHGRADFGVDGCPKPDEGEGKPSPSCPFAAQCEIDGWFMLMTKGSHQRQVRLFYC